MNDIINSRKSFCGYVHADTGVDGAAFKEPTPPPPKKEHSRNKRQTSAHNTCPLMLVADYHFFQGVGGSDVAATARYLVTQSSASIIIHNLFNMYVHIHVHVIL